MPVALALLLGCLLCACAGPQRLELPPGVVIEPPPGQPAARVIPRSAPGIRPGAPIVLDLGHCGLASPIDVDGSLWRPVGGEDANGRPIDDDAETGELINATRGTFELLARDVARFVTPLGSTVWLERRPGAADYPFCD